MSRVAVAALALLVAAVAFAEEQPIRDPMRPFGSAPSAGGAAGADAPRFVLTAVLIAPSRRVAVVNGEPTMAGEIVDGVEVVAIEPGAVRMREHGVEFVLLLGRPKAGRPPTVQGESVP